MPALTHPAQDLPPGAHTARWGAWVIGIRSVGATWDARVWSWSHGARVAIGKRAVLATANDAVAWACTLLRQHGARAFVDGRDHPLEAFLVFTPTPGDGPCS